MQNYGNISRGRERKNEKVIIADKTKKQNFPVKNGMYKK